MLPPGYEWIVDVDSKDPTLFYVFALAIDGSDAHGEPTRAYNAAAAAVRVAAAATDAARARRPG